MPSWKKVITSGSDATLRSVTATAGFTGSFSGSLVGAASQIALNAGAPIVDCFVPFVASILVSPQPIYADTPLKYNPSTDTLKLTGSFQVTGSGIVVTGSVRATAGFTGSLLGTASIATNIQPSVDTSPQQSARFIPYLLTAADSPQQIRYTSSLQYNQVINQVFTTASWANTASFVTGSIFSGSNQAASASYALSASHLIGGGAPYSVYVATFQANGTTDPVVNVLQDSIGIGSWTNNVDNYGSFTFTTTGTTLPFNKTYWSLSVVGDDSATPRLGYLQINGTQVTLYCTDVAGNPDPRVGGGTALWGNIEIRRYP